MTDHHIGNAPDPLRTPCRPLLGSVAVLALLLALTCGPFAPAAITALDTPGQLCGGRLARARVPCTRRTRGLKFRPGRLVLLGLHVPFCLLLLGLSSCVCLGLARSGGSGRPRVVPVDVAEVPAWLDDIPHAALQLLGLGEAAVGLAVPEDGAGVGNAT